MENSSLRMLKKLNDIVRSWIRLLILVRGHTGMFEEGKNKEANMQLGMVGGGGGGP
jgi:hypothetical protein